MERGPPWRVYEIHGKEKEGDGSDPDIGARVRRQHSPATERVSKVP